MGLNTWSSTGLGTHSVVEVLKLRNWSSAGVGWAVSFYLSPSLRVCTPGFLRAEEMGFTGPALLLLRAVLTTPTPSLELEAKQTLASGHGILSR